MARLEVRLGELTAAMLGIMNNQLSRRNILPYVRSDLALKLKPIIAEIARENQGARNDICQKSDRSPIDTKREIAKAAGMLNFSLEFLAFSRCMAAHHCARDFTQSAMFKGIQGVIESLMNMQKTS